MKNESLIGVIRLLNIVVAAACGLVAAYVGTFTENVYVVVISFLVVFSMTLSASWLEGMWFMMAKERYCG